MGLSKPVMAAIGGLALLAACGDPELILTGERLDLRADLDGATPADPVDLSTAISLPAMVANADWTQKAGGATHRIAHPALGNNLTRIWSAPIGEGDNRRHRITADPVVADGRIFTVDSRARVMAHSTAGAALWSVDLTPPSDNPDDASGAGLAVSGNRLFVTTGFGDLVALDVATGARLWTQELDAAPSGAPTVVGDLVYLVTRDALAWAVRTDKGRVEWTLQGTPSPSGVVGGAAPAVNDRVAVFPFAGGELVSALRSGGTRIWGSNVAGTRLGRVYARVSDISGDPVIDGDRVYAGSPSGRTVAIDLTSGETLWSAREGAMSPVVVAGGSVFTVSDRAELVRLDAATGGKVWGSELPFFVKENARKRKAVFGNYGPILAGGQLWVASGDGALRAFSPESGAATGGVDLPGGAATNPVVAGRTLYVVSSNGQLHAFR
ncbi:PQQ-binding-like beta-propeller repeat protein [Oceaniglobus trochenteri]|uniref:outer membrane protein assembly factor BamB family protein n=1 Tax=Oceaniglobus trochenteri TaxID=2763260 RepID=UPI001CFF8594|nr:PQQ-binding-like beta-propeller repeat protein [Oceaniglobus trochenteri]